MKLSNQYTVLRVVAKRVVSSDDPLNLDAADDYDENEPHDQELEDVNNMVMNVGSVASNSYRRTRTSREFPIEIMMKALKYANGYRDWVKRKNFPVSLDNADAAISALTDAILDWRRTGGVFETAHYHKGADPASAENLEQFALFFHKRIHQPLVYGKQWGEFPHYWDLFIKELHQAFEVWKQQRAEQKTWGEQGEGY